MFHVSRHIAVPTVSAPLKVWDCHMQVPPNVCTDVRDGKLYVYSTCTVSASPLSAPRSRVPMSARPNAADAFPSTTVHDAHLL